MMPSENPQQSNLEDDIDESSSRETAELSDTQADQPRELTLQEKAERFNEIARQIREARKKGEAVSKELESEGQALHKELTDEKIRKKQIAQAEKLEANKPQQLEDLQEELDNLSLEDPLVGEYEGDGDVKLKAPKPKVKAKSEKSKKKSVEQIDEDEEYYSKNIFGKIKTELHDAFIKKDKEGRGFFGQLRSEIRGIFLKKDETIGGVLGEAKQEIKGVFGKSFWGEAGGNVKEWWSENATWKFWKWLESDRTKKK